MNSEEQESLLQNLNGQSSYAIEDTLNSIQENLVETLEDIHDTAQVASKKISYFWTDFSRFINSNNLFEVAVGIIIGNGVSTILKSLVDDIFLPPLSLISLKNQRMKDSFIVLSAGASGNGTYVTLIAAKQDGAITLNLGYFLENLFEFLATALVLFWIIKLYKILKDATLAEVETSDMKRCLWCCENIMKGALKCKNCSTLCSLLPTNEAKTENTEITNVLQVGI